MMLKDDFLNWAFSNVLDNSLRGVIGEYIVHRAVGGVCKHRINWDACDVEMEDGTKIEVKVSGYIQSWSQKKPSTLVFDISKKDPWLAFENRYLGYKCRYADVWVLQFMQKQPGIKQIHSIWLNGNFSLPHHLGLMQSLMIKRQ